MKIGVNLLNFTQDRFGGVEQYIRNLMINFMKLDPQLQLFLFVTTSFSDIFPYHPQIKRVFIRDSSNHTRVIEAIQRNNIDIWFCPIHRSYLANVPVPTVVTIHDVLHAFYPDFVSGGKEENTRYYQPFVPSFDAVLTVSKFSKKTITEQLLIPAEKVHVIYSDASPEFLSPPDRREMALIKAKYQLPYDFALYPASYNPHKNHHSLLKALILLRDKYNQKIPLVLTGFTYQGNKIYQSILKFIEDYSLGNQVKIIGYIPQKEMPLLYHHARFLIFPSLFEGFGIPLVEAMKTQTPIVCSNQASIPEVVGDAALQFDPHSPQEIASAILQITYPKIRYSLIQKGKEQAKVFSWKRSAWETLNVFYKIHQKKQ